MPRKFSESHLGSDPRTWSRVSWARTMVAGAVLGGTTLVVAKPAE